MDTEEKIQQQKIEEWKVAVNVTMHFNDLLIRLRGIGLPIIVSIGGAGVLLGLRATLPSVPVVLVGILIPCMAVFEVILVKLLVGREHWGRGWVEMHLMGKILWWTIPFVTFVSVGYFWARVLGDTSLLKADKQFPLSVVVLVLVLFLLLALYLLDRFYYYKLLIGGVLRLEELEKELNFSLTLKISQFVPRHQSALVITTLYLLPGIVAYLFLLFLLTGPDLPPEPAPKLLEVLFRTPR